MFQSPGRLLLILYVRSYCTQESSVGDPCEILVWGASAPGRCVPGLDIVISVALKVNFRRQKRLCNGFNLADAARLVNDDHYFKSGRKSFRFIRKKTEDRSDTEIVIPIIEPLQKILDEIAAEPIKGSLVFPQIYTGEQNPWSR